MTDLVDPSLQKLYRMLGPDKAQATIREVLLSLGLSDVKTPDERLRFGAALIRKGGLLEAIGRSIRVQAILHGASED